jgi:hypothetical protein
MHISLYVWEICSFGTMQKKTVVNLLLQDLKKNCDHTAEEMGWNTEQHSPSPFSLYPHPGKKVRG